MDNIFDIRFSFEQYVKDNVIVKFSNKQGGGYNIFSFHWQCFAWAAIVGFLRDDPRPLKSPIADRPFDLTTMRCNKGEKIAQALICMCIAKAGSLDIMKNPEDAINMINEYANGGFYHIMKLMENGENSFNDLEKVKQEIFSRGHEDDIEPTAEDLQEIENTILQDVIVPNIDKTFPNLSEQKTEPANQRIPKREIPNLIKYYKSGMSVSQLAQFFHTSEKSVTDCLNTFGL